jgi:hypothetical protein
MTDVPPHYEYDHWTILLSWEGKWIPKPNPFRFGKLWVEHSYFIPNIERWWNERTNLYGTKIYQFQERLKNVKMRIKT